MLVELLVVMVILSIVTIGMIDLFAAGANQSQRAGLQDAQDATWTQSSGWLAQHLAMANGNLGVQCTSALVSATPGACPSTSYADALTVAGDQLLFSDGNNCYRVFYTGTSNVIQVAYWHDILVATQPAASCAPTVATAIFPTQGPTDGYNADPVFRTIPYTYSSTWAGAGYTGAVLAQNVTNPSPLSYATSTGVPVAGEALATNTGSTNLIGDPSFEADTLGAAPAWWSAAGSPTTRAVQNGWAADGSQSLRVTTPSCANCGYYNDKLGIPITGGQTYTLSFSANVLSVSGQGRLYGWADYFNSSGGFLGEGLTNLDYSTGVATVSTSFTAPAGSGETANVYIYELGAGPTGSIDTYIDQVYFGTGSSYSAPLTSTANIASVKLSEAVQGATVTGTSVPTAQYSEAISPGIAVGATQMVQMTTDNYIYGGTPGTGANGGTTGSPYVIPSNMTANANASVCTATGTINTNGFTVNCSTSLTINNATFVDNGTAATNTYIVQGSGGGYNMREAPGGAGAPGYSSGGGQNGYGMIVVPSYEVPVPGQPLPGSSAAIGGTGGWGGIGAPGTSYAAGSRYKTPNTTWTAINPSWKQYLVGGEAGGAGGGADNASCSSSDRCPGGGGGGGGGVITLASPAITFTGTDALQATGGAGSTAQGTKVGGGGGGGGGGAVIIYTTCTAGGSPCPTGKVSGATYASGVSQNFAGGAAGAPTTGTSTLGSLATTSGSPTLSSCVSLLYSTWYNYSGDFSQLAPRMPVTDSLGYVPANTTVSSVYNPSPLTNPLQPTVTLSAPLTGTVSNSGSPCGAGDILTIPTGSGSGGTGASWTFVN
jgi:hypothetical protein